MRNLSDTIARLAAFKHMKQPAQPSPSVDRLAYLGPFGSNPGALKGRIYIPKRPAAAMPLVVVLHGCTQSAAQYDAGTGWSMLAEEAGFALLFPEQGQANNLNRCFNWFQPSDFQRDQGEALSIRQMIDHMVATHSIDRSRVYVTGLSAGGAMALVMLADYPELFAGGAIIAGLPYGVATTIPGAFDVMRAHGLPDGPALRKLLPDATPSTGWPTVSVWQGTGDQTVSAANADAIIEQWRGVHQVAAKPDDVSKDGRVTRRVWHDARGDIRLEQVLIAGMGHGTPIDDKGPDALGAAGPFILDVGLSSTRLIAARWGLTAEHAASSTATTPHALDPDELLVTTEMPVQPQADDRQRNGTTAPNRSAREDVGGIRKVIEDALRQAGLM
ncbi:PHB depolymerase family esterase [Mesorhizobium sp. BR1-1-16]|uniref:extracellular catalytic domain type 1 short-chain-length polyhydroxyalkanoate depolymerase n=1 Tax=Mesorhizobium sp. BR1-1-16 TaxID=2876653 RepID=UPI001CCFF510|nr:PHB depolymerase family esterase [Mesorhizobium sp. BR1-1-16]MBZ9935255.1 PHB depolymerase family esterase [Mesorhizobium sp. BR1-1-16]